MKDCEDNYVLTGLIKYQVCVLTMVGIKTTNKLKDGSENVLRFIIKEVSKVFNIYKKIN